jgi:hypothetical protein
MGPRTTRHEPAPPSDGRADAAEGASEGSDAVAGADAGGTADGGRAADVEGTGDADAGGSAGPALPGDPLHAVRTAKTSRHGARTLLLYYA